MANTPDYTYYTGTFKGNTIPQAAFDQMAMRAGSYLDMMTNGQFASAVYATELKMAACAVAEALYKTQDLLYKTSESTGSYAASIDIAEAKGQAMKAAKMYLWNTGLLFAGVV